MASVAPRTKMISLACAALRKRCTLSARPFVLFRRMLGKEMHATMDVGVVAARSSRPIASMTTCGFWDVAALSRYTSGLP